MQSSSVTYADMNAAVPRLAYRIPKRRLRPRRKRLTFDPVKKLRKKIAGLRSSIIRRLDAIKFRFGKPQDLMKKRLEIGKLKRQYDMHKRQLQRMLESREKLQSTSSAKPNVKEYEWFTYMGKRVFKILDGHRSYDLEMPTGKRYGLKKARKNIYLLCEDDTTIVFKLSEVGAQRLIKASKGYTGKIGRTNVVGGRGMLDKPESKPVTTQTAEPVKQTRAKGRENKKLTRDLQALKIPGIEGIKFIMSQEMLPGEVYHFYDVETMVIEYQRKHRLKPHQFGNWASDLERDVEAKDSTVDVQLATMKTPNNTIKHVMSVIEE